jgi:hypothetical protein
MSNRNPGRPATLRPPTREESAPAPPGPQRQSSPPPDDGPRAPACLVVGRGDPPEHLFRRLLSSYLAGAPSFEVVERPRLSSPTREVVRAFCRRTRGPTPASSGPDRLRLDDRRWGEPTSVDEGLRALGDRVLRFHRDAVESWDRLAFGDDTVWERADDDVDREAWFLQRCIALGEHRGEGLSGPATAAWTVARSLERIADHAVTLGEMGPRLAELDPHDGAGRELRQFHRQAMTHLAEVLASPDGSRANDLLDVGEALLAGGRALSERLLPAVGDGSLAPAAAAAIARALEAIGRTVAYSQDIARVYFDRAVVTAGPPDPERAAPVPLAVTG